MLSLWVCIGKIFWGIAQSMILTFWKETVDFVAELMMFVFFLGSYVFGIVIVLHLFTCSQTRLCCVSIRFIQ